MNCFTVMPFSAYKVYITVCPCHFSILYLVQTPMKQHKDCNFSYAGLKTQVRLAIESRKM